MDSDLERVRAQLCYWQSELLDLSNRNRLLNFRNLETRPSALRLEEPHPETIFDALLDGKTLTIVGTDLDEDDSSTVHTTALPGIDLPTDSTARTGSSSLKQGTARASLPTDRTNRVALRLASRAKASLQEQGISTLYAAFGLLKWQEKQGARRLNTDPLAPIVLLPISIREEVTTGVFRISSSGSEPEVNLTLSERLKKDFGFELDVALDDDTRLADVLSEVRKVVAGREEWEVRNEVYLGHFQFHKLRMYKDLEEHESLAGQHEIIRALALDTGSIGALSEGVPPEEGLDERFSPTDTFTILDADASQLLAIEASTRGTQFIVSGPPGTGKSQTIANIIAENLAAKKTILFVSEKSAAIEVVHRRVTESGLGDHCLMLHSHKANKRDVIQELGDQLDLAPSSPPKDDSELRLKQLADVRSHLDDYSESLHRVHAPMMRSAFWAIGQLASLDSVPLLSLTPPPMSRFTPEVLDEQIQTIRQLSRFLPVLEAGANHPWNGFAKRELTLVDRSVLQETLRLLPEHVATLQNEASRVATALGIEPPLTIEAVRQMLEAALMLPESGGIRAAWLNPGMIGEAEALVVEAVAQAEAMHGPLTKILERYHSEILAVANDETLAAYEKHPLVRLFSSNFKHDRACVRGAAKNGQGYGVDVEINDLKTALEINKHVSWFHQHEDRLAALARHVPVAAEEIYPETWRRVQAGLENAKALLKSFNGTPPPAVISMAESGEGVESIHEAGRRLAESLALAKSSIETLRKYFEPGAFLSGARVDSAHLDSMRSWIELRTSSLDSLDTWLQTQIALERVQRSGLSEVTKALRERKVAPEDWTKTYQKLVLTHWLDWIMQNDPGLRTFNKGEREEAIERFRSLDHFSIGTASDRIHQKLIRERPAYANIGEPAILHNERVKQRRHMPLRRLFQRLPNLIPQLKPCLMMSPLSVAQYLPANLYKFDIVIFDEASQVRPHDAIGAIMRGKQLIVAGDSKQLPPTSFFDKVSDEVESDEEMLVDIRGHESILDLLKAKNMPELDLRWHYRSRHEDLIAFSNTHIYKSRLITFPTPASGRTPDFGVHLDYVPDGRYVMIPGKNGESSHRVNEREAARVVELVLQHARNRPNNSLGVVTLGLNHKETIDEALTQARRADPTLEEFFDEERPEPFFVKALEQVQGDERDVIIISIGYGKNENGALSHNFGPVNRQGGERRLNVLVTRARNQVIVVSSIKASDIDLTRIKSASLGPPLFKSYLDFAERGSIALQTMTTGGDGDYESPFELEVGEALARLGYVVHRQVGCSKFRIDLAIVHPDHPGRYLLGIECDGKAYHQAKTARDRDRLRQEILENLGWTIHRIWSTAWIRNPERELEQVVERVQSLLIEDRECRTRIEDHSLPLKRAPQALFPPADDSTARNRAPLAPQAEPRINRSLVAFPYLVAQINTRGEHDFLSAWKSLVAENVIEVARIEGPIHHDLLIRRVSNGWGYERAGTRIVSHIDAAIRFAERQEKIICRGNFIWASEMERVVPRGADPEGTVRRIEHISDEELVAGMSQVLASALSLSESDLVTLTARFFGYQRTGRDIKQRLAQVIPKAVQRGTFTSKDDHLHLAIASSSA